MPLMILTMMLLMTPILLIMILITLNRFTFPCTITIRKIAPNTPKKITRPHNTDAPDADAPDATDNDAAYH